MRIQNKDIVRQDNLITSIVLSSLTREMSTEAKEKGYVDIVMTINGVEVDIEKYVNRWQETVKERIVEAAKSLLDEKFQVVQELLGDLQKQIEEQVDHKLINEHQIKPGDYIECIDDSTGHIYKVLTLYRRYKVLEFSTKNYESGEVRIDLEDVDLNNYWWDMARFKPV